MGSVNTNSSIYSSTHISLESINPLFNSETPMYLIVDEMKLDSADYDVDVTLTAPVSNFWKSYPENGKTHVEIRTKIDTDNTVVRTVTCTCASGHVYTNIFTKNNGMVYSGRYSDTEPAEELYYSDIKTVITHAVKPSTYRDDRTSHFDALMSAVYGTDVHTSDLYKDITIGANGIKPHELITSGRLFEFMWWLMEKELKTSPDDAELIKPIPMLNMTQKLNLFSNALDVRFAVYELFLTLCAQYDLIKNYTPSIPMYTTLAITPNIVVAAYIASTQWKYTGWTCIDDSCIDMVEKCDACVDTPSADIAYPWNTSNMYNSAVYKLYDTIPGAVTNEHLDLVINNGCVNTKQVPFVCPDAIISLNTTIGYYNGFGISYGDLDFKPIDKSMTRFIILKKPNSAKSDIRDIITASNVKFIGDTDIANFDIVTADVVFDTDTGLLTCNTSGTNSLGVIDNRSPMYKYLGALNNEAITLGTPDNTSSAFAGNTYDWFSFNDTPYVYNDDIGLELADLSIYGNSVQNALSVLDSYVRVETTNANIVTNQINNLSGGHIINPINNLITDFAVDDDTVCINMRTYDYISVARADGDTNTAFKLLARFETVDNPDKTKAHFAILTYPGELDDYHDIIPCPFDTMSESCDIRMDITLGEHVKFIYLAYDSDVITKIKSVCIVPAGQSFTESRYNRTEEGVSLKSIPVLTSDGSYDVRYKDKLTRNKDGIWVVEHRILPSKIHVKEIIDTDTPGTTQAVFVNDTMVDVKCDIASSDAENGKYVFYLGKITAFAEYGNTVSSDGTTPIYIFNAKDNITDVARITSTDAIVGYIPVGTSIADMDVNEYIIDIPMAMRGTECIPASVGYIVDADGVYNSSIPFIANDIDSQKLGYDVRGNRVAESYGASIAVVCNLSVSVVDPVKAFMDKLSTKPITFRYAPVYEYDDNGELSTPYPVTRLSNDVYTTEVERIPLEVAINPTLQNQYNSLRAYKNGHIGLITFGPNAYLEAKYTLSSSWVNTKLDAINGEVI